MTASTASPTAGKPVYRNGEYLRYTAGQAISIAGDQVWFVALAWAAVQMASPTVAGMVMTAATIPRLLLMLFGGVFVDRFGPKRMMIGSNLVKVVVSLTAAAVALSAPGIPLLVVVAVAFGAASALFMPAAGAIPPLLLDRTQLSSGIALRELTSRAALTVGSPLGGVLVATGGLALASVVMGLTFLVSVAVLWSLRPREVAPEERPDQGTLPAVKDGLRYLRRHRLLRSILIVGLLSSLGFVGPMNVGLALISQDRGWGSSGVGLLLAGFGIGAAASAVVLLRHKPTGAVGPIAACCASGQGAGAFGLAVVPQLWTAVTVTALIGLLSGILGVLLSSLTHAHTADAYRGRVSSVSTAANLGLSSLAVAATGIGVDLFGIPSTFGVCAGLCITAAIICLTNRELRTAKIE